MAHGLPAAPVRVVPAQETPAAALALAALAAAISAVAADAPAEAAALAAAVPVAARAGADSPVMQQNTNGSLLFPLGRQAVFLWLRAGYFWRGGRHTKGRFRAFWKDIDRF